MASNVGMIGLGSIGYGMASNLRKKLPASTTLHIYDISAATCQRFVDEYSRYGKIELAPSPKSLASNCRTLLSSLPAGPHVRKVYLDTETGIIEATKNSERLLLDFSTIEIEGSKEIGETLAKAGVGIYVDTPIAGGAYGAAHGTLSFMVGYPTPIQSDVVGKRIFETLSLIGLPEQIQFCGGPGMGQVAKIAHNYVCLCYNLAATEGMALGLKYGIDKKDLWKVMTNGCANSFQMHLEQPVPGLVDDAPSSNGYRMAFAARLTVKDLRIAIKAAKQVGLNPSAAETALQAFEKVDEDPRTRDLDHTSLWLHVNDIVDEFVKENQLQAERPSKL